MRDQAIANGKAYAEQIVMMVQGWYDSGYQPVYPKNANHSRAWKAAYAKYNAEVSLMRALPRGTGQISDARVEEFTAKQVALSILQWQGFVNKLIEKTGDVTAATLISNRGVWDYSVLEVTTANGEVQRWKTQTIVNTSCLGKLFNQFPTRLMKGAA